MRVTLVQLRSKKSPRGHCTDFAGFQAGEVASRVGTAAWNGPQ